MAPITTTIRGLSTEVPDGPANGIGHESVVSCDNIVTINKAALGERIGYLFPPQETLSPPLPTLPSTSNSGCRFAQHRASSVS